MSRWFVLLITISSSVAAAQEKLKISRSNEQPVWIDCSFFCSRYKQILVRALKTIHLRCKTWRMPEEYSAYWFNSTFINIISVAWASLSRAFFVPLFYVMPRFPEKKVFFRGRETVFFLHSSISLRSWTSFRGPCDQHVRFNPGTFFTVLCRYTSKLRTNYTNFNQWCD